MNGQMLNCKRYQESLSHTPGPIMPSQLPKVKMNLAGLSRYAKNKGVAITELSQEELDLFLPKNHYFKNI